MRVKLTSSYQKYLASFKQKQQIPLTGVIARKSVDHMSHVESWEAYLKAVYDKKKSIANYIPVYQRKRHRDALNAWKRSGKAKEYDDLVFLLRPFESYKIAIARKVEIICFPHQINLKRGEKGVALDLSFVRILPEPMKKQAESTIQHRTAVIINNHLVFLNKDEFRVLKKQ